MGVPRTSPEDIFAITKGQADQPLTGLPPTQTALMARSSPIMMVGKSDSQMSLARALRWAMAGVEARLITVMSASIPAARLPMRPSARRARAEPWVASHQSCDGCRGVPLSWPTS